ncbi:MAG: RidA family protein [Gammaproteobacteria bacterium]|nr:RidA family protein [Gammaproteobacteria bacterium]MDE2461880.1 RidA family protein [Gammaproteobacteria bacterium]
MTRNLIHSEHAPEAIGPYSQAVRAGNTVYLSGQIGLDPRTGELVTGGLEPQARRVFENLQAVAEAAGDGLQQVVRVTVYLTDLRDFAKLNEVMVGYFSPPYPARVTVGVAALPRGAVVEVDAVMAV